MREERLKKIQEILSNYSKVSDVVDYYQLFQLDPSMSIEEITKYLKEMRFISSRSNQLYSDRISRKVSTDDFGNE